MLLSFMLRLFIYVLCYLCRTIALVATVFCRPYPTLNKFYFILSYLIPHRDDVIKWRHFPRYWTFVWGIQQSLVNSLHIGQWRGGLMFSFICAWTKRLDKQSRRWWFETPSRPLWRHCNWNETLCHTPPQNPQIQTANIFSPYKFNLIFRNGERNVTYGRTLNR